MHSVALCRFTIRTAHHWPTMVNKRCIRCSKISIMMIMHEDDTLRWWLSLMFYTLWTGNLKKIYRSCHTHSEQIAIKFFDFVACARIEGIDRATFKPSKVRMYKNWYLYTYFHQHHRILSPIQTLHGAMRKKTDHWSHRFGKSESSP